MRKNGSRRFYVINGDLRKPIDDWEFPNENEMVDAMGQQFTRTEPNPYAATGYFSLGLPPYCDVPKVQVAMRAKPLDAYGLGSKLLISSRAKRLLESIDPDGFIFLRCETETRRGQEIEDYWLMTVDRVVADFDLANSVFTMVKEMPGAEENHWGEGFVNLLELSVPNLLPDIHAFFLIRYPAYFIFDGRIVDAWCKEKMNGLGFSPLQTPTVTELKQSVGWLGQNASHWSRKAGLM